MGEGREYDMIEGYLDGTLQPESARELERLAANDPELAAELKAEQAIRGTLARDVAALPVAATEPSAVLMAKLAATSGASGGAVAAVGIGGGSGVLGTIFGTGAGLTVVTIVGLLGLALGAWLFAENAEDYPDLPETSPAVENVVGSGGLSGASESAPELRETSTAPEPYEHKGSVTSPVRRQEGARRSTTQTSSQREEGRMGAVASDERPDEENTTVPAATTEEVSDNRDAEADALVRRLQAAEKESADQDPAIPTMNGSTTTITVEVEP